MSQNPAFMQLYVGDYLADTLHLTTEQHGAYLLLLMTMWRNGAELPNDHQKLARIARVTPKRWGQIWAEIGGFFEVDGTVVRQPRLSKEFQKAVSISQERKTAGKIGGKANALKKQEAAQANASDLFKHAGANPYPDTIKKEDGGGGSAREAENSPSQVGQTEPANPTFRERILAAIGVDPVSGLTGHGGRMLGTQADMAEVARWQSLGLTDGEILGVIGETMAAKRDGPPSGFGYFAQPMARLKAAKDAPPPEAIQTTFRPIGTASPKRLWTLDPEDFDDEGNRIHDRFAQG